MAYTKTTWQDTIKDGAGNVIERGTPINASKLNKIEDAIEDATIQLAELVSDIDAGSFTDTTIGIAIDGGAF